MIITKIKNHISRLFAFNKVQPISKVFGFDRGKPIDRYYIEKFLSNNKEHIHGVVLEVEENAYTKLFASENNKSYILKYSELGKVESTFIYGDLTKLESIPYNSFDTFICTQTLNFIFEVNKAIESIHSLLRKNGTALITVACISQISRYDADRWGDFWRFTPQGIQNLFNNVFGKENVELTVFGNSFAASHFIKGFSSTELKTIKLDAVDEDYPVIVALKVTKDE
jgi:hypothetical protein